MGVIGYGLGVIGAGIGIGLAAYGAATGMARQPEMQGRLSPSSSWAPPSSRLWHSSASSSPSSLSSFSYLTKCRKQRITMEVSQ